MKIKPEILKRFFSGAYSRKDMEEMKSYFRNDTQKEELLEQMQQHWMEYNDNPPVEGFDSVLNNLQRRIYLDENKKTIRLKPLLVLQRIAAILIIPLILAFVAYVYINHPGQNQEAYAEIYCPLGTRTKFVLPDGSTGFLNNGSTLKYPVQFAKSRKVTLTGEAFFNVEKNGKPFHVYTKNLDVKVMGTSFNVLAYENDQREEVVLQTGKVNISSSAGSKLTELIPDQQLVLDNSSKTFTTKNVTASQFTSWIDGKLVFRNEGMDQVAKRLSRWYNADVKIDDEKLKGYTFHATFVDEQLDQVLRLLSLTTPIEYEEVKMKKTGNGETLPKRQITLKLCKTKIEHFN